MDPIDDKTNPQADDDRRLDLLVDGELSDAERCGLLRQLEHEPDGWRRCALAFVESQCWKQDLTAIAPAARDLRVQGSPVPQPASRRSWPGHLGTLLAMAASFLAALALGTHWRPGGMHPGTRPSPDSLAATTSVEPAANAVQPPGALAGPRRAGTAPDRWQTLTLVSQGPDGREETIQLPAVERESLDPRWVNNYDPAVPSEVLQALQQTGHQVETRRELVPLELKDGRRLVVPVDQVDVHVVGRRRAL